MPIPVPTLDELLFKRPVPGTGFRIQNEQQYWDQGNWDEPGRRWDGELWFAVELAVPPAEGQSVWGASEDDPFADEWAADEDDPDGAVWGAPNWEDVTPWVQEITLKVGRPPASAPGVGEVGVMSITLDNRSGQFMPWSDNPFTSPTYMQAGTIARVVIYDPVSLATTEPTSRFYDEGYWKALFTGPTESWTESTRGVGAVSTVLLTCTDTLVYLSRLDSPPLIAPTGQDTIEQRVNVLTTAYGSPVQTLFPLWQHPSNSPGVLVSVTGAGNALQNIYAACAQADQVFYAEGTGRHVLRPAGAIRYDIWGARVVLSDKTPGFETRDDVLFLHVPYVADSLSIANDTDTVVNKVDLTTPAGTPYTYDSPVIDQPWSEATWSYRATSQYNEATASAASAWLAAILLAKGAATVRPALARINAAHGPEALRFLIEHEPHRLVRVEQGNVHFIGPVVSRISHTIRTGFGIPGTPDRELVWSADIELDTSQFSAWSLIEED
jgi:hypothetical protein